MFGRVVGLELLALSLDLAALALDLGELLLDVGALVGADLYSLCLLFEGRLLLLQFGNLLLERGGCSAPRWVVAVVVVRRGGAAVVGARSRPSPCRVPL